MNRPDTRTMVLGHPTVAAPVELGGCLALIACWQCGANGIIPGAIVVAVMAATAKATERASAYRKWKREWDALGPPTDRRKRGMGRYWAYAAAIWLAVILFLVQDRQTQSAILGLAILLGIGASLIVGLSWAYRRLSTRKDRRGAEPVASVARPVLPVPPLQQAYAALPDFCQRILTRPAR